MKCSHCNLDFEENKIHEHHIHPKFMDNKKGDGIKINLCEKCHNILHLKLPVIYWNIFTEDQKRKAIEITKKYSLKYGGIDNDSITT